MTITKKKLARHLAPPTKREKAALGDDKPIGRVYGYCRVSTVQQANEGLSLEVQQRQVEGYAHQHGWPLEKVYVEKGVSGSKPLPEREQGSLLIQALQPGDIVITPKLDRMFRSAQNALDVLGHLKDGGVSLYMLDLGGDVTGNGVSKLVFTILSAVAENERERTKERITEVKRDQKMRGRFLGGLAPFGWRKGDTGDLVPVPEQQKAIARMKKLRAEGESLRSISAAMKASGIELSHVGVGNALKAVSS